MPFRESEINREGVGERGERGGYYDPFQSNETRLCQPTTSFPQMRFSSTLLHTKFGVQHLAKVFSCATVRRDLRLNLKTFFSVCRKKLHFNVMSLRVHFQGDQIGLFFAYWAIHYLGPGLRDGIFN
jgi:hypothetical protein